MWLRRELALPQPAAGAGGQDLAREYLQTLETLAPRADADAGGAPTDNENEHLRASTGSNSNQQRRQTQAQVVLVRANLTVLQVRAAHAGHYRCAFTLATATDSDAVGDGATAAATTTHAGTLLSRSGSLSLSGVPQRAHFLRLSARFSSLISHAAAISLAILTLRDADYR